MGDSADRTVLVINGRVTEIPAHQPGGPVRIENSVPWWESVALFGALLIGLAAFLGARDGAAAAVGGVALFLLTAVLAGTERYEFATAAGVAALLWTSAGVALYLGVGSAPAVWFVTFASAGSATTVAGTVGAVRLRSKGRRRSSAGP